MNEPKEARAQESQQADLPCPSCDGDGKFYDGDTCIECLGTGMIPRAHQASQQEPVGDSYLGWARVNDHDGNRAATIHFCDSDAPGAFKVYRASPTAIGASSCAAEGRDARAIANEQAEDADLWFMAKTASEAYLQELRRLTMAIESTPDHIAEGREIAYRTAARKIDALMAQKLSDEYRLPYNAFCAALRAYLHFAGPPAAAQSEGRDKWREWPQYQNEGEDLQEYGRRCFDLGIEAGRRTIAPPAAARGNDVADRHEREITELIDQRDKYHDIADRLSLDIAAYLGVDIGEHTSGNFPWDNAIEAVAEAPPAAARVNAELVAALEQIAALGVSSILASKIANAALAKTSSTHVKP